MSSTQYYYQILQLPENATLDQVKTAFRRLARRYHPDLNQDDPQATAKFRQILEAYQVLTTGLSAPDQKSDLPEDPYRDCLLAGVKKALNQDYPGALAEYARAIQLQPDALEAYLKRCELLYKLRDDRGVLADCHQILTLEPQSALGYYYQGRARFRLGSVEGAISSYTQAINYQSRNPEIYYHRAIAYQEIQETTKAVADLETASQLFEQQGDKSGQRLAQSTLKSIHKTTPPYYRVAYAFLVNPTGPLPNYLETLTARQILTLGFITTAVGLALLAISSLTIFKIVGLSWLIFLCISMILALGKRVKIPLGSSLLTTAFALIPFCLALAIQTFLLQVNPTITIFVGFWLASRLLISSYSYYRQLLEFRETMSASLAPLVVLLSIYLSFQLLNYDLW